jgi:hypothetical protein
MSKMSRKDPYDPWVVVAYALDMAKRLGKDKYVVVKPNGFTYAAKAPLPCFSHWKVAPDGKMFAHMSSRNETEYKYEIIEEKTNESKFTTL